MHGQLRNRRSILPARVGHAVRPMGRDAQRHRFRELILCVEIQSGLVPFERGDGAEPPDGAAPVPKDALGRVRPRDFVLVPGAAESTEQIDVAAVGCARQGV